MSPVRLEGKPDFAITLDPDSREARLLMALIEADRIWTRESLAQELWHTMDRGKKK